jgi:hypothetical protein
VDNLATLSLHAARNVLEKRLAEENQLPAGKYDLEPSQVIIDIAGGELSKSEGSVRPKFTTFPMDLAAAFLLHELPPAQRARKRAAMFKLFEDIESGNEGALAKQAELAKLLESIKSYKKQTGETEVKGALKCVAIGKVIIALQRAEAA